MHDNNTRRQPRLSKKLTLHKDTVRVLTDKELAGVEGGAKPTAACTGDTCGCGTCGNNFTTCPK
jgi:bacteriocin-like protein